MTEKGIKRERMLVNPTCGIGKLWLSLFSDQIKKNKAVTAARRKKQEKHSKGSYANACNPDTLLNNKAKPAKTNK